MPSGVNYGEGGGLSNPELDQIVDNLRRDMYVVAWVTKDCTYRCKYEYQVALSRGKNPLPGATIHINGEHLHSSCHTYDSSFAYYDEANCNYPYASLFSLNIETATGLLITGSFELMENMGILSPPNYYDHSHDSSLTVTWAPIRCINYYKLEVERNLVEVHSSNFLSATTSDYTIPDDVFEHGPHYIYVYGYKELPISTDSTLLPRHLSDNMSGASGYFIGILKSYVIVDVY
jgi:hypothetical protein